MHQPKKNKNNRPRPIEVRIRTTAVSRNQPRNQRNGFPQHLHVFSCELIRHLGVLRPAGPGASARWLMGCFLLGSVILTQSVSAQSPYTDEGFTEPFKTVTVASPESGVLQTILVREGDSICEGDIIARLDSQVLIASVNAAREKLKSQGKINGAKATLQSKSHHLEQMRDLLKQKHASDKEVRLAQLEFDLANANLESAQDEIRAQEMEIKRIEAQLQRRIVRASTGGIVLELPHQTGESISAAENHVATLVALDQLRVRYFLTTEQANSMQEGDRVDVRFPDTQRTANAIVDFISPVTDSKSGTVRVELLIENKNRKYRSGLRCVLGGVRSPQQLPATPQHHQHSLSKPRPKNY